MFNISQLLTLAICPIACSSSCQLSARRHIVHGTHSRRKKTSNHRKALPIQQLLTRIPRKNCAPRCAAERRPHSLKRIRGISETPTQRSRISLGPEKNWRTNRRLTDDHSMNGKQSIRVERSMAPIAAIVARTHKRCLRKSNSYARSVEFCSQVDE